MTLCSLYLYDVCHICIQFTELEAKTRSCGGPRGHFKTRSFYKVGMSEGSFGPEHRKKKMPVSLGEAWGGAIRFLLCGLSSLQGANPIKRRSSHAMREGRHVFVAADSLPWKEIFRRATRNVTDIEHAAKYNVHLRVS